MNKKATSTSKEKRLPKAARSVSEKTRAKMSSSQKARWAKVSPSRRKKLYESRRGVKRTEETRKKMSLAHMGHPVSDETRRKISLARAKAHATAKQRKAKSVNSSFDLQAPRAESVKEAKPAKRGVWGALCNLVKNVVFGGKTQEDNISKDDKNNVTSKLAHSRAKRRKFTPEHKEKLAAAAKARWARARAAAATNTDNKFTPGYKVSDETRAKMSAGAKQRWKRAGKAGRRHLSETIKNKWAARTPEERKMSDEQKQKIAFSQKRRWAAIKSKR